MDNQQPTKMPKPFDSDHALSGSASGGHQQQQFELREDDRLKQEEDFRQGEGRFSICAKVVLRDEVEQGSA